MWNSIKNNLKSDGLILLHSNLIRSSLLISGLIVAFILSTAGSLVKVSSNAGYYTSQLLITFTQFNVFFLVIVGSFLGAMDYDWKTYSIRLINSKRITLCFSRLLLILISSFIFIIAHVILGSIFDSIGKTIEVPSWNILLKYMSVLLVAFFWGCLSFFISLLTRSFALASSIGISYLLLESYFNRFFPETLIKILPVWNQKSLLKPFFMEAEGAVALIQLQFGEQQLSLTIFVLYNVLAVVLSFIFFLKMEHN